MSNIGGGEEDSKSKSSKKIAVASAAAVAAAAAKKKDLVVSSTDNSSDEEDSFDNSQSVSSVANNNNNNNNNINTNHTNTTNNAATNSNATTTTANAAHAVPAPSSSQHRKRKSKKRIVWEVIEGYRDTNLKVTRPQNYEGIVLKRRNWPMKGWHKRYFILADGILSYGKSKNDLMKNKVHGTINAYLSIVSYHSSTRRILIDSSSHSSAFVCHLKARDQNEFELWLDALRQHRLYYQFKYTQQYSTPAATVTAATVTARDTNAAPTSSSSFSRLNSNNISSPSSLSSSPLLAAAAAAAASATARTAPLINQSSSSLTAASAQSNLLSTSTISQTSSSFSARSNNSQSASNIPTLNVIEENSAMPNNISSSKLENLLLNASEIQRNAAAAAAAAAGSLNNNDNNNYSYYYHNKNANDESNIEICFKQVEENLMNLSKALSSLYLATLNNNSNNNNNNTANADSSSSVANSVSSASGTATSSLITAAAANHLAVDNAPTNNNTTSASSSSSISSYVTSLMHKKQKSNADFTCLNTNSSKIHVSKSNPNLINNDLLLMTANVNANANANNNNSNINSNNYANNLAPPPSNAITTTSAANSNTQLPPSLSINGKTTAAAILNDLTQQQQQTNNSNYSSNAYLSSSLSATQNAAKEITNQIVNSLNSLNLSNMNYANSNLTISNNSNNSSNQNDDQLFKLNFYQGAKQINDQLIFIYKNLLSQHQKQQKQLTTTTTNPNQQQQLDTAEQQFHLQRSQRSQSVMSSISLQDSQLPFFDAIEYFTSDSESDDDTEQESDTEATDSPNTPLTANNNNSNSKSKSSHKAAAIVPEELKTQKILSRRRKLPAPSPDSSQISVWGILRKAIGKDLSKISLPVVINEPLSILQRLCEELEYSDLLDYANGLQDPLDRMVYVAAFVISGYASSYYRNGAKDFNPILGETYELTRPDKGWRYVAEQVSHHPPISCCHCQSKSFTHEQMFHAKIKFWGKSMEVHPEGYSRVTLAKFNEAYQWNKIVMYVYNVMGSARRIEHYGEITIRCTSGAICTISFPKASYCTQKNEFFGEVVYENVVKRKIFGQWHDAFLCGTDNTAKTIWRMGAVPEDSQLYYGFTRFAIELNEFTENLRDELPATDSRFRPDQRYLEEGLVDKAEQEKQRIEEIQRKRRREMDTKGEMHQPLWFNAADEQQQKDWTFNNQYWLKRENPGFKNLKNLIPQLW